MGGEDAQGCRTVGGGQHTIAGALQDGAHLPFAGLIFDGDEHHGARVLYPFGGGDDYLPVLRSGASLRKSRSAAIRIKANARSS